MTTETTTPETTTVAPTPKAAAKKAVKKVTNKSDAAVKKHANAGNTSVKAPAKKVAKKTEAPVDQVNKEIRWSEKKIVLIRTLVKLGAISGATAVTQEKINKKSNDTALTTLNPAYDLTVQGYLGHATLENDGHCYFATPKAVKFLTNYDK